jgi:hypothetical protein
MPDTVLEFPKPAPRATQKLGDTGFVTTNQTRSGSAAFANRMTGSAVPIDIDQLYPRTDGPQPHLIKALDLLAQAVSLLDQCRTIWASNPVEGDRVLLKFHFLLRDLFRCRDIGNGFSQIVNTLQFALINQKGKPLTFAQLTTVWRIVKELRTRPLMSFDEGINAVSDLEESGLEVDPPILSELVSQFDDD